MDVGFLLRQAVTQVPLVEAKMLLQHVLHLSAAQLAAHPECEVATADAAHFDALITRRTAGEPVAYLLGKREFHSLEFIVTADVLIPRPETELLVELALEKIKAGARRVLDLGTGSGAIAVSIAANAAEVQVFAGDVSAAALDIAKTNALKNNAKVTFREGSWFAPFSGEIFDIVVSNPPYIVAGDRHLGEGDVRFEPQGALVGGADGLDCIRAIVEGAAAHLVPGGWLFIEHGYDQAEAVRALLSAHGFGAVQSWNDLAGIARISGGCRG